MIIHRVLKMGNSLILCEIEIIGVSEVGPFYIVTSFETLGSLEFSPMGNGGGEGTLQKVFEGFPKSSGELAPGDWQEGGCRVFHGGEKSGVKKRGERKTGGERDPQGKKKGG